MNYIGTQSLETERLLLRRLEIDDYMQAYNNIYSNENIAKRTLWEVHENPEITRQLFDYWKKEYNNPDTYRWVIISKEANEVIGIIDTQENKFDVFGAYEIGYCLCERYWSNGYMTEALKIIIKFFMEHVRANVVFVESLSNNMASTKVLEKVGMKQEGILKNRIVDKEGNVLDIISYSITLEDYEKAANNPIKSVDN